MGARVAGRLEQAGQVVEETLPVPSGISAVTPMVEEMVMRIESWRHESGIERVVLFFITPEERASFRPRSLHLLPVETAWLQRLEEHPWPTHILPTFTMDWSRLFAALIREYFFVSLYRAFAESLASENASRLASMQAAEKNIEERLNSLNTQFHELRQRSMTEELLDVVAGFEVLREG